MSSEIELEQNKMIEKITEELKKLDKYLDKSDERIYGKKMFDDETEERIRDNIRIDPKLGYMEAILPFITFRISDKVINDWIRHDNLYFLSEMPKLIFNSAEIKGKRSELLKFVRENNLNSLRRFGVLGDICNRKECDKLTKLINEAKNMEIINEDDINDLNVNMINEMFKRQCNSKRTKVLIACGNPYYWESDKFIPTILEKDADNVFFNGDWDDYDYLFAIQKIGMKQIGIEIDEQEVKKKFLEKREHYKTEQIGKEDAIELKVSTGTTIDMMIELLRTYRMIGKTAVCKFNDKQFFSCDDLDVDNIYKEILGKSKKEVEEEKEAAKRGRKEYIISMKDVLANGLESEEKESLLSLIDEMSRDNDTKGTDERKGEIIDDN